MARLAEIGLILMPLGSACAAASGQYTISVVAGTGRSDFSGDNGPATSADMAPRGIVVDGAGNLYIADNGAGRIRKVSPAGIITSVAGGGANNPANGQRGLAIQIGNLNGVAADAAGNLYIANDGAQVVKVSAAGIVSGTNTAPAVGVAVDRAGNVYTSDRYAQVLRITPAGVVSTVAGTGFPGYTGDNGPAVNAQLRGPVGLSVDSAGNVYIADSGNHAIRKVSPSGIITTVAGTPGSAGYLGDGGPATSAQLAAPDDVAVDSAGNLFIADTFNSVIREVDPTGVITTIAGNHTSGESGDGGPALNAQLVGPAFLALDASGRVYISDPGTNRVRVLTPAAQSVPPSISSLNPASAVAGGSDFILTVNGAGFASGAVVQWNGTALATTLVSATQLTAQVPASLIAAAGNVSITVMNPGGVASNAVAFTTSPLPPQLGVSPSTLSFSFQTGAAAPSAQPVSVTSTGSSLNFAASVSAAWLSLDASTGVTPATLNVSVNPAGLASGTYTATVTISATGAANSPQQVGVTLTVSAAVTLLADPAAGLVFQHQVDAPRPGPQGLVINSSGDPIGFTASVTVKNPAGPPWLSVDPRSGTTPKALQVSVNPAGLAPGAYDGGIVITPTGAGAAITVPVQLIVSAHIPSQLQTDTNQLTYFAPSNGPPQQSQIKIVNPGTDLLNFSVQAVTDSGAWLRISRSSGGADAQDPAVVVVTADPASLAPGTYAGQVIVQGTQDLLTVPVALTVGQRPVSLVLSQSALRFTTAAGLNYNPPDQPLDILARGQGTLTWSASTQTQSGGNWLSIDTSSGQVAAGGLKFNTVQVHADARALAPGEYHGQVRIDSPDADNSPQLVTADLVVLPQGQNPGPFTYPTGLTFVAAAGGSDPPPRDVLLVFPNARSGDGFNSTTVLDFSTPDGTPNWLQLASSHGTFDPNARATGLRVQVSIAGIAPGIYRGTVNVLFPGNISRNIPVLLVVSPGTGAGPGARSAAAACTPTQYLPLFTSMEQNFSLATGAPAATELVIVDDCGNPVVSGSVGSTFSTRDRPLDLVPLGDGRWRATWVPRQSSDQGTVTVNVLATDAAQTVAQGSAPPLTGLLQGSVNGPVLRGDAPILDADGNRQLALAPGSWIRIRGVRLAQATIVADPGDLPDHLGQTQVTLGGEPLWLQAVSPEEIVALVPDDVPVNTSLPLVVAQGDYLSAPEMVLIAQAPASAQVQVHLPRK